MMQMVAPLGNRRTEIEPIAVVAYETLKMQLNCWEVGVEITPLMVMTAVTITPAASRPMIVKSDTSELEDETASMSSVEAIWVNTGLKLVPIPPTPVLMSTEGLFRQEYAMMSLAVTAIRASSTKSQRASSPDVRAADSAASLPGSAGAWPDRSAYSASALD